MIGDDMVDIGGEQGRGVGIDIDIVAVYPSWVSHALPFGRCTAVSIRPIAPIRPIRPIRLREASSLGDS